MDPPRFWEFYGQYPVAGDPCPKRARIANPWDAPDQFHAKKGDFHAHLFGKAIYEGILTIGVQFGWIKNPLTGINQWQKQE